MNFVQTGTRPSKIIFSYQKYFNITWAIIDDLMKMSKLLIAIVDAVKPVDKNNSK